MQLRSRRSLLVSHWICQALICRLLHIHHNRPGMLSRVNEVFSGHRVNVAAQYLQTSPRIGYVVIDVDAEPDADTPALRRELAGLEGTIKARLLY